MKKEMFNVIFTMSQTMGSEFAKNSLAMPLMYKILALVALPASVTMAISVSQTKCLKLSQKTMKVSKRLI